MTAEQTRTLSLASAGGAALGLLVQEDQRTDRQDRETERRPDRGSAFGADQG